MFVFYPLSANVKIIHLPSPEKHSHSSVPHFKGQALCKAQLALKSLKCLWEKLEHLREKVPLGHLSAKAPSLPLETKGCFKNVMVFSLSAKEAPF